MLMLLLLAFIMPVDAAKKNNLPFATKKKHGHLATKRNKQVKNNTWIYRQYGKEGR